MIENSKAHFLDGQTLLLKKPVGWSSFDVVRKIRFLIKKKYSLKKIKIGHAGTLDPLATGSSKSQFHSIIGTIALSGLEPILSQMKTAAYYRFSTFEGKYWYRSRIRISSLIPYSSRISRICMRTQGHR